MKQTRVHPVAAASSHPTPGKPSDLLNIPPKLKFSAWLPMPRLNRRVRNINRLREQWRQRLTLPNSGASSITQVENQQWAILFQRQVDRLRHAIQSTNIFGRNLFGSKLATLNDLLDGYNFSGAHVVEDITEQSIQAQFSAAIPQDAWINCVPSCAQAGLNKAVQTAFVNLNNAMRKIKRDLLLMQQCQVADSGQLSPQIHKVLILMEKFIGKDFIFGIDPESEFNRTYLISMQQLADKKASCQNYQPIFYALRTELQTLQHSFPVVFDPEQALHRSYMQNINKLYDKLDAVMRTHRDLRIAQDRNKIGITENNPHINLVPEPDAAVHAAAVDVQAPPRPRRSRWRRYAACFSTCAVALFCRSGSSWLWRSHTAAHAAAHSAGRVADTVQAHPGAPVVAVAVAVAATAVATAAVRKHQAKRQPTPESSNGPAAS